MPLVPDRITSRANARVKQLRAALTSRHNEIIGVEGLHLLREAVSSGLEIHTIFLRDDRASVLAELPDAANDVLLLSPDVFDSVATTEHAQGVAAILRKPQPDYVPCRGDLLLVADGLQDPGNLGTLIRSAEAFGAAAVALAPKTVDPWNGKCLRAAAGAAFRIPLPRWNAGIHDALRQLGARIFAATAHGGIPAHLADLRSTTVLVIGNEAAGVSGELLAASHERITLPTVGPTESLNAAMAGTLLLYEASRQRAQAFP